MSALRRFQPGAVAAILIVASAVLMAQSRSDILAPEARRPAVDLAQRLAKEQTPPDLPKDLQSPFHPTDFDRAAPGEAVAGPAGPVRPTGARAILETAGPTIQQLVVGTIQFRGELVLQLRTSSGRSQSLTVGQSINVTVDDVPYSLTLVAIDTTSFTLSYQNQRLALPISSPTAK